MGLTPEERRAMRMEATPQLYPSLWEPSYTRAKEEPKR